MFLIFSSFCKSLFLLFKKPNLIFGMGGYSSFPVCLASKLIGIPFIIYENNLHIGKANKFLLPFAKKLLFHMLTWMEFHLNTEIKYVK